MVVRSFCLILVSLLAGSLANTFGTAPYAVTKESNTASSREHHSSVFSADGELPPLTDKGLMKFKEWYYKHRVHECVHSAIAPCIYKYKVLERRRRHPSVVRSF